MGPRAARPSEGWTPGRKTIAVVLVGTLLAAGLTVFALSEPTPTAMPSTGTVPPGGPANANLSGSVDPPVDLVNGQWGVDLRADVHLTSADAAAINSTGTELVRWPGGALGDRFDPIANAGGGLIYQPNGSAVPPDTTFAQFVTWCGWVHCQSVVTLPAEVDNGSLAAAIVSYSLHTLDFRPTFWEIGNEPALWTHFGIPWSSWNTSQDRNTTPLGFAEVVRSYVTAIRSVDPATPIVGMGGTGVGGPYPSSWIEQDVETNGPNISALAIHVYPAGPVESAQPPSEWFAALQSSSALPNRVNATMAQVNATCPTCHLGLLVDELGTGTSVPPGDELSGGYLASFVAAELVQSLPLPLRSLDYYNLRSGTPGAWFSTSGVPSPAYSVFADWQARMGPYAAALGVHSQANGLLAAVGGTSPGSWENLLLVNANSTFTFSLNLRTTLPKLARATILEWDGPSAAPNNLTWGPGGPTNLSVPPMSLVILSGAGAPQFGPTSAGPPHRAGTHLRDRVLGGLLVGAERSGTSFPIFSPSLPQWGGPRAVATADRLLRGVERGWVRGPARPV